MIILVLFYNSDIELTRCSSDVSCSSTFFWSSISIYVNLSLYFMVSPSSHSYKMELGCRTVRFLRIPGGFTLIYVHTSSTNQTSHKPTRILLSRESFCVSYFESVYQIIRVLKWRGIVSVHYLRNRKMIQKKAWVNDR